jgi:hypothetical protein
LVRELAATLLAIVMLVPSGVWAEVSVDASLASSNVPLGGQVELTLTVEGNVDVAITPRMPEMEVFEVYSAGSSRSVRIVNGVTSSSLSFSYILVPLKPGEHQIPVIEIRAGDKSYYTQPLSLEVSESREQPDPEPRSGRTGEQKKDRPPDVFIKAEVDKKKCYVNEQVVLTFSLYRRISFWDAPAYNPPEFTGFWVEDLPPQEEHFEIVSGLRYVVTEIRTALFPTSPGTHTIQPFRLTYREGVDAFSFFSPRAKSKTLRTEPMTIEVLPLPAESKPPGFTGTVGSFDISASIDKTTVEENQPVTLTVVVSGEGNVKTIADPVFPEFKDFKKYDSGSSLDVSKAGHKVSGRKSFELVLIPIRPGKLSIPPVELTYFDPEAKRYKTVGTREFAITSTTTSAEVPFARYGTGQHEISPTAKDILYIKAHPGTLSDSAVPLHRSIPFLMSQAIPVGILLGAILLRAKREKLRTDEAYARRMKADPVFKRRLSEAGKLLRSGRASEFYALLSGAMEGLITDRLGIPARGMTTEELSSELEAAGLEERAVSEIVSILSESQEMRFAPGEAAEKSDTSDLINRAKRISVELRRVSR